MIAMDLPIARVYDGVAYGPGRAIPVPDHIAHAFARADARQRGLAIDFSPSRSSSSYYTAEPGALMFHPPRPRWARPTAAFVRATDAKRWAAYRAQALRELDVLYPTGE